jgi:hypothetical protein
MIHHVSIPAENPALVCAVLAELMGGKSYPFPGGFRDSFMAISGDAHGTAVEVYPTGLHLTPDGADEVKATETGAKPSYSAFHLLLSVDLDQAAVERIGAREGWLTRLCDRGPPGGPTLFQVIEFWLENRLMVEVAPRSMIGDYERLAQSPVFDRMAAGH